MAPGAGDNREGRAEGAPETGKGPGTAGAAAGYLFACLLLVFSLLARSELTAMTENVAAQAEEIRELEEENARLQIARGEAMDLEEAEKAASELLGMCRPRPGQIDRQETVLPDRVTLSPQEGAPALIRRLEAYAGLLGECFS